MSVSSEVDLKVQSASAVVNNVQTTVSAITHLVDNEINAGSEKELEK